MFTTEKEIVEIYARFEKILIVLENQQNQIKILYDKVKELEGLCENNRIIG